MGISCNGQTSTSPISKRTPKQTHNKPDLLELPSTKTPTQRTNCAWRKEPVTKTSPTPDECPFKINLANSRNRLQMDRRTTNTIVLSQWAERSGRVGDRLDIKRKGYVEVFRNIRVHQLTDTCCIECIAGGHGSNLQLSGEIAFGSRGASPKQVSRESGVAL